MGSRKRPTDSSGRNGSVRGHAVEELLRRSANRGYAELLDELRAFAPQSDTDDMAEEDIARSGRDRVSSVSARLARSVAMVLTVLSAFSLFFAYLAEDFGEPRRNRRDTKIGRAHV